jgi:hypothetical protein
MTKLFSVHALHRILIVAFLPVIAIPLQAGEFKERFLDEEDGMLDISNYLANPGRFLPVPLVITEPAVGYGLGLAAVFLQPRKEAGESGWTRPNISAVAAMATENGTSGGALADLRHWGDGSLKTKAVGITASVNLDFYRKNSLTGKVRPLRYNLDVDAAILGVEKATPVKNLSVQLDYTFAKIKTKIANSAIPPGILPERDAVRISGLTGSLVYDSRDNLFSPQSGVFSKTSFFASDEAFGADRNFQRLSQVAILYWQLNDRWMAGLKMDGQIVFGDFPFYAKPFIALRGVPAMRYQGESVAFAELEVQYKLTDRFRVLGFAGGGKAWDSIGSIDFDQSVLSGGLGLRYRIARKFGLDMGLDLATSGDDSAIYLQFGSAWLGM